MKSEFISLRVLKGEQILFYNKNDLESYNSHMTSIQNIVKQQQEISRQSFQKGISTFDRVKGITK